MRMGIAAKLALLLALVGALAAGVTGFYAFQTSRALLVDSAKTELLTSTQVLARRITLTREEISRNLQVLARHPAALATLQHDDPANAAQLAVLFGLLMEAHPAYFQLRLISAADHGLERVRMDRRDGRPLQVEGDDLQEKGHYPYVAETLRLPAGSTYLSRVTVNHEIGTYAGLDQPALQLATPVMDARGAALGVVVVNVDLNGMFGLLAKDLPPSFRLFMANGEGDILIHPDASKTFGFDKGRRVLLQDEFPATAALVAGKAESAVFETPVPAATDEGPMVAAFIAQNIRVASDENRLLLGLAQPLSQVLAQSGRLGTDVLQIVVALSMACLLLAALLARAITGPINAVNQAAQGFATGQLMGRLPMRRRDEIGALARSFRRMQDQITQQLADLQIKQEELEHLAHHDILTGLLNRRIFTERLEQALAHARRYKTEVCLLFIDLDEFKAVNDDHGHDAGDAVLKAVAERLLAMMREVDTVARLGGDEFVVLLGAPTPPEHVSAIAEKLLEGLRAPIPFQAHQLQTSASIGISRYPLDGQTASEIISNADQAMYRVKASGRGGFRFFSASRH